MIYIESGGGGFSRSAGPGLQAAADHIVDQQCVDYGWGWPHDDCSTTYNNITAPIAMGLLQAYEMTEYAGHLTSATNAGDFDLTFQYSNGEARFGAFAANFLWTLSQVNSDPTYSSHAETEFFDELTAGTYGPDDYDTAGWIAAVEAGRTGTWVNLRPWEFHNLIHTAVAIGNTGQAGLFEQGVLDGLNTLDNTAPGSVYSDLIGLAGGVCGLANAGTTSFTAINAPLHAGIDAIDNLQDLADALVGYQNGDGSWYWHSNIATPDVSDKDVQTTAYAVMALLKADPLVSSDYYDEIVAARDWLWSMQDTDGGFFSYPGGGHNTEVEGEVLSAMTRPGEVWVDTGYCDTCDNDGHAWGYDAFDNIQDGIDAVYGSTVYVAAGTYPLSLTIGTNNLSLIGAGMLQTYLTGGVSLAAGVSGVTLQHLNITGDAGGSSVIRAIGVNTDFTMDHCLIDGGAPALSLHAYSGGQLEGDPTITYCEFKDVARWSLLDSRSGSGGDGSAMGTVTFAYNYIHECDGAISFRGLSTSYTTVANVHDNVWENINENFSSPSDAWACYETNRVQTLNFYNNTMTIAQNSWGEGQGLQCWAINTINVYDNVFDNCYQGIWCPGLDTYAAPAGSAHNNDFSGCSNFAISSMSPIGAPVATYTSGDFDARGNWWGDVSGPYHASLNPAGTGTTAIGDILFDPWYFSDGYQLNQTADFYHISVDDPGVQTPEHDPLQYQATVTYDLVMATPTENWRATTAFIAYDPLVVDPVAVTQIYDPAGGDDHLMSNLLNNPDGMLEITWYITGITDGVQGGHTLFSVTFDGLAEDVIPGTIVHIDQVVMRNPDNAPINAAGGNDIYINVDHSPPVPFVVVPPVNSNINADPTIYFDASDNVNLHRISYEIVGYAWDFAEGPDIPGPTWSGNWTMDVSGIPDGDYTVNFRCWDDVGYYTDGASWDFHLDRLPPTPPADLTAAPRCAMVHLEWTAATEHDSYELWREKRVPYPYYYDYVGGTGGLPGASGSYSTMIPLPGGITSYDDDNLGTWDETSMADRAVYDYKLIAIDSINPPAESDPAAATNYFLGDWFVPYDCNVGAGDLAALSIHYGTISQATVSDELDVAPTSDWGRFGLPGPDGLVNFEDLIVMAMNYRASGPPTPFTSNWPLWAKDEQPQADEGLMVRLYDDPEGCELVVSGTLFAMSLELVTTRQLISVQVNDMLALTYATPTGWIVDLAAMGELRTGETVVQLQFQMEAEPGELQVIAIDARGAENNSLPVDFQDSGTIPAEFSLAQNYPNPFNPVTTINYDLAETVQVELLVYNSLGQQVATLVNDSQPAGRYSVSFNGSSLASGLYFYSLQAGEFNDLQKMLLVK